MTRAIYSDELDTQLLKLGFKSVMEKLVLGKLNKDFLHWDILLFDQSFGLGREIYVLHILWSFQQALE